MGTAPTTLALLLTLTLSVAQAAPETAALTILHSNDAHGRLLPFRYPALARADPELEGVPTGVELGGIARRATLVRRIREEQEARGIPVWLVDAGDFAEGRNHTHLQDSSLPVLSAPNRPSRNGMWRQAACSRGPQRLHQAVPSPEGPCFRVVTLAWRSLHAFARPAARATLAVTRGERRR